MPILLKGANNLGIAYMVNDHTTAHNIQYVL